MTATQVRNTAKSTGVCDLTLDGGNTNIKYMVGGTNNVCRMPSFIKLIDTDIYEVDHPINDPFSATVEFEDETYLVGSLAAQQGGQPIFQLGSQHGLGKSEYMHIMFMAALRDVHAYSSAPVIETLRVLVPDARRQHLAGMWNPVKEMIQAIKSFRVNGKEVRPQVRNVQFVSEGIPAFRYVLQSGAFDKYKNTANITECGVLDIGGGETTFKLFDLTTGTPNWDTELTVPGINTLATNIAKVLKAKAGIRITPTTPDILRCLANRNYTYQAPGVAPLNFTDIYKSVRNKWSVLVLQHVASQLTSTTGGVVIVGGGANHAEDIERKTDGRFFVVDQTQGVNAQEINAYALTNLFGG